MHPYIPHLLSDIAAAHRQEPPEPEEPPKSFEEEMEAVEQWFAGEEPEHTFGYHCGLKPEEFPPAVQLTTEEMELVCKAFQRMMFTWNLGIDLPETLPSTQSYEILVGTLERKTNIVNSGFMSFDFCCSYPPDCIYKEYCSCKQYWNKEGEMPSDVEDEERPF